MPREQPIDTNPPAAPHVARTPAASHLARKATGQHSASPPPASRRGVGWSWWDAAAVVALAALVPVVHDLGTFFRPAYWLDEAWVAVSVKAPPADLPAITGPTPLGWLLLVRLVPAADGLRLVTLVGLVAAVGTAYCLGRGPDWPWRWHGVVAGLAAGAGVVLLPAMQAIHDLKQFTTDAAVAIGLLALAAWAEAARSRRRLATLVAFSVGGMLLSHVAAIMAVAVMVALSVEPLIRRHWRELTESLIAGVITAAGLAAVYVGVTARGRSDSLDAYWAGYLPAADARLPGYVGSRLREMEPVLGLPWLVFGVLAAGGVVVIARRRRTATAAAVALVPIIMIVLGVSGTYPLLDRRTSTFALALGAALGGIGVAGAGVALATRRGGAWIAMVTVTVAMTGFAIGNHEWWRLDTRGGPDATVTEDIRGQVHHVAAHRRPGDVILLSAMGVFGFAYYWDADEPSFVPTRQFATRFTVDYPAQPDIVITRGRDTTSAREALDRAERLASQRRPRGRIWLIRTHLSDAEAQAWSDLLAGRAVTEIDTGVEPLLLVLPLRPA